MKAYKSSGNQYIRLSRRQVFADFTRFTLKSDLRALPMRSVRDKINVLSSLTKLISKTHSVNSFFPHTF